MTFIIPDNLIVRLLWGVAGIAVVLHWCHGVVSAMEELDEQQQEKIESDQDEKL